MIQEAKDEDDHGGGGGDDLLATLPGPAVDTLVSLLPSRTVATFCQCSKTAREVIGNAHRCRLDRFHAAVLQYFDSSAAAAAGSSRLCVHALSSDFASHLTLILTKDATPGSCSITFVHQIDPGNRQLLDSSGGRQHAGLKIEHAFADKGEHDAFLRRGIRNLLDFGAGDAGAGYIIRSGGEKIPARVTEAFQACLEPLLILV